MYISVIIPTYNRVEKLERCLHHITNQSIGKDQYEIIIVDDCSKDFTPDFCKDYASQNENVRYVRNNVNKGLATTRNEGIRNAKGDLFLFLDNDLLVNQEFLEEHLKIYKKFPNEKLAVVSNITYPPQILTNTNFGSFIQSRAMGYRSKQDMEGINISDLPSNYFAGGGSSCRREDAYAIGLFEEGLKKYGSEDELFGYRFKNYGGRICFCENAKIIHDDENVLPQFWRTKYIELGRYSLRTLAEKEPELVNNSLYNFLMPINKEKDELTTRFKKTLIKLASSSFFRVPVEKFVIHFDKVGAFNFPVLHRYLTVAWMKKGFDSDHAIEEVKY